MTSANINKQTDLKFNVLACDEHPVLVMEKLGIKYSSAEPQPIADQWMFFDCSGVKYPLPAFLEEVK